MRFISALSILTDEPIRLTGTPRLLERPSRSLNETLAQLGKTVVDVDGQRIITGVPMIPDTISIDARSSGQFVSGLLMALAAAHTNTTLIAHSPASRPFIDMTLEVMWKFGARVRVDENASSMVFTIRGSGYTPTKFDVEPDIMSANYLFATPLITGVPVFVPGLKRSTAQGDVQFLTVLEEMGLSVEWCHEGVRSLAHGHRPRGTNTDITDFPDMALTIGTLAAIADSPTTLVGTRILRYKESDRIEALQVGLAAIGAESEVSDDDDRIVIHPAPCLRAALINSYDDHRVAMAFGLLTLINPQITISDPTCTSKTWPGFFREIERLSDMLPSAN